MAKVLACEIELIWWVAGWMINNAIYLHAISLDLQKFEFETFTRRVRDIGLMFVYFKVESTSTKNQYAISLFMINRNNLSRVCAVPK